MKRDQICREKKLNSKINNLWCLIMYGARELNGIELTGGINKSAQPDQLEITRHYSKLLTHATFYASLNTLVQL